MNGGRSFLARLWPAVIAVVALAACCGYLVWTNHTFEKRKDLPVQQTIHRLAAQGPAVGTTISLLRGQSLTGQAVNLDLSHREKDTLLLVLSPVCPYCRVNFHNWRSLLARIHGDQVIWVDLTGTADANYLASVGIPGDATVVRLDSDNGTSYGLTGTPTTVLLDPHGVVRWASSGVLKDEQVNQLRGLLSTEQARD
jgi:hypothetical protein